MRTLLLLFLFALTSPSYALSIADLTDDEVKVFETGLEAKGLQDYETARKHFLPLALKGLPSAQIYLGWFYLNGLGGTANVCEGIDWIDQAAREGSAHAQVMLATLLYDISWGHRPDYHRSYGWLLTAIQNGATKGPYAPDSIPHLFTLLEEELSKEEMRKIKDQVADGSFNTTTPANKYIVRLTKYRVGDHSIPVAPCSRLYPD